MEMLVLTVLLLSPLLLKAKALQCLLKVYPGLQLKKMFVPSLPTVEKLEL
jgi:hypothetical protein